MTAIDWRETSSEALGIESWRQMQPPVHEALINGRRYLAYQVTGVRRDLARVVIARAEVSEEDRWEANPLLVLPMLRPRTFRTLTLRILWEGPPRRVDLQRRPSALLLADYERALRQTAALLMGEAL